MKTLYIERSTGECRDGSWTESLDLADVGRIVVGIGPGSFAGIRGALAFAQGYALGRKCEVLGLPSACAIAASVHARHPGDAAPLAVIGDARRGKAWIAPFEGMNLVREVFQVELDAVVKAVPAGAKVVSPDDRRIGDRLREAFGDDYLGDCQPTAEGLRAFAEACPAALVREPLPIYLNPAVRD